MTRIGWLMDNVMVQGGQELSMQTLIEKCPYEIVPLIDAVASTCDAFIVGNCVNYTAEAVVPYLRQAPVIKRVADWWPYGDPVLREWLLTHSRRLIFLSESQLKSFPYWIGDDVECQVIPPPIDLEPFRLARKDSTVRKKGALWLAQATDPELKGVSEAIEWAITNREVVHFYGVLPAIPDSEFVKIHKQVPHSIVPQLMASFERFLFLPRYREAFGRTVIEALAAGCKVVTNMVPGSIELVQSGDIEQVETSADTFWEMVTEVLNESPVRNRTATTTV